MELAAVGVEGGAAGVAVEVETDVVEVDVALVADGEAGAGGEVGPLRLLAGGREDGDEAVAGVRDGSVDGALGVGEVDDEVAVAVALDDGLDGVGVGGRGFGVEALAPAVDVGADVEGDFAGAGITLRML